MWQAVRQTSGKDHKKTASALFSLRFAYFSEGIINYFSRYNEVSSSLPFSTASCVAVRLLQHRSFWKWCLCLGRSESKDIRSVLHRSKAPSFRLLKKYLGGRRFHADVAVKQAVSRWLESRSPEFYADGSIHTCDKCLNFLGGYVEKKFIIQCMWETFFSNKGGWAKKYLPCILIFLSPPPPPLSMCLLTYRTSGNKPHLVGTILRFSLTW
jgi:hypothetical protein